MVEAYDRSARGDRHVHAFAELVASAHEPAHVESELVRLAHRISGARRAELYHDPGTEPVACWPPRSGLEPAPAAEAADPRPEGTPLLLALRFGDRTPGTLRLLPAPRRRWSPGSIRRLTTLCVLAAAEHVLRPGRPAAPGSGPESAAVLHDATYLNAILPYALAQAKRHHEPLSLLCVGIDRLAAIHQLHGPELVEAAVRRVASTILKTIRTSDVVARLEDHRLIVILPIAGASDGRRVAEVIREATAVEGAATPSLPALTASIGVACFPAHAQDVSSLIAAADDALAQAEHLGRNRVVLATRPAASPLPALTVSHRAG